jgi:peptidoglycan/xylan/chitin deacetylase (PgdA/CDA1 family)
LTQPRLHRLAGPPGTELARWLEAGPHFHDSAAPIVGPSPLLVARISGTDQAERDGAAGAEAAAVQLHRRGVEPQLGEPDPIASVRELIQFCRERGRSSVALVRGDPSLAGELQIGSWFNAPLRARIVRRLARRLPTWALAAARSPRLFRTAADAAFWAGVRSAATGTEWNRLTSSSYVGFVYHRLAGDGKPGQEKIDTSPARFAAQLRLLRLLRFRMLSADELLAVLSGAKQVPRRCVVLTFDDGTLDCLEPLRRHASQRPILFVPTGELSGPAHWLDGEPTMSWDDVRALAKAGVAVGAHARRHRRLAGLPHDELVDEAAGSLADLRREVPDATPILAYPHGSHDVAAREAAAAAGFEAAFTTEKGRNGLATDRFCLRRISVHGFDGPLAVAWKAATGEPLPRWVEHLRRHRVHVSRTPPLAGDAETSRP